MKKTLFAAVALFMFAVFITSRTAPENTKVSVGLWQVIEPDGPHLALSLTDTGDGTVKLPLYDTFWTLRNGDRELNKAAVAFERKTL